MKTHFGFWPLLLALSLLVAAADEARGQGGSETTTISNRPPTAFDQNITIPETTFVAISLAGNDPDGDALSFLVLTPPAHGTLFGSPPIVTYAPHYQYNGTDSFTFAAFDGQVRSAPATVHITITPVNGAPTAQASIDNAITFLGERTVIAAGADGQGNPLATVIFDGSQSMDVDGDPLTYLWSIGDPPLPFGSGVRVTNELAPGMYKFELLVSDTVLTGIHADLIDVLTPCDAVGLLIVTLAESALPKADKRPLIKSLEAACNAFDARHLATAVHGLKTFQHKAAVRLRDDPALVDLLIRETQTLIDAVLSDQQNGR